MKLYVFQLHISIRLNVTVNEEATDANACTEAMLLCVSLLNDTLQDPGSTQDLDNVISLSTIQGTGNCGRVVLTPPELTFTGSEWFCPSGSQYDDVRRRCLILSKSGKLETQDLKLPPYIVITESYFSIILPYLHVFADN